MLGYISFYSQLIRVFGRCNNISNFLFREKLRYFKLGKSGCMHSLLFEYFKRFCLTYNINKKNEKNNDLPFSRMIK